MKQEHLKKLKELKDRLEKKHIDMAEPMKKIPYTRENYDSLFPDSKISTPAGEVKMGGHQFEKLDRESRQKYLGGMYQTLTDPISIISQEDNRGKSQLFTKSFNDNPKKLEYLMSAIADMNGTKVSISTHPKDLNNILNKIKKVADVVYEKPVNDRTAGTDPKVLANINIDDTQLPINIPQKTLDVKGKNKDSPIPYPPPHCYN